MEKNLFRVGFMVEEEVMVLFMLLLFDVFWFGEDIVLLKENRVILIFII